jgi:hypothetical protein
MRTRYSKCTSNTPTMDSFFNIVDAKQEYCYHFWDKTNRELWASLRNDKTAVSFNTWYLNICETRQHLELLPENSLITDNCFYKLLWLNLDFWTCNATLGNIWNGCLRLTTSLINWQVTMVLIHAIQSWYFYRQTDTRQHMELMPETDWLPR